MVIGTAGAVLTLATGGAALVPLAASAGGAAACAATGAAAAGAAAARGVAAATGVAAGAGAGCGAGAVAGLTTALSLATGPIKWIVLGADRETLSGDCWKPVVRECTTEPSHGRLLRDVLLDPAIKQVMLRSARTEGGNSLPLLSL